MSEPTHVIDRDGQVWALVHDGGMATRATYAGIITYGIVALDTKCGPLIPFDPVMYRDEYNAE